MSEVLNTHEFNTSRFTHTVTCAKCGLLPMSDEEQDSKCDDFRPDMDSVYSIDADGNIREVSGEYAPESVQHWFGPEHDFLIDGMAVADSDWSPIKSYTGQYGYNGPVLHVSELFSPVHVTELTELAESKNGTALFTTCWVEVDCSDGPKDEVCFPDEPEHCRAYGCDAEPAGWVILAK